MSGLAVWLGGALALVVAALGWRGFRSPAPVPRHMLRGGPAIYDVAVVGLEWLTFAVKLAAIPLVAWAGASVGLEGLGAAVFGAALTALVAAVIALERRRPRTCAEPLRDEAVFVGGCAVIAATVAITGGALGDVALGLAGGLGLALVTLAVFGAGFVLTWGARPTFVQMRQPTFRILGDNPDALTVIARVRVEGGLRLTVPHVSEGPVTFGVYSAAYKRRDELVWATLRPVLEDRGEVTILVGRGSAEDAADVDFCVPVEPGRYFLSIRNYRPHASTPFPSIEVVA